VPFLLLLKPVRRVLSLLVLAVLLVVGGTAAKVWWVARQDERPRSDAIVVLGAAQFDGRPSKVFASRLDHAADLFEEGVAPRVVTLGGGLPGDRFTEAQSGATYLKERGVTSVLAVGEGNDTLQSLRALERALQGRGWHSIVLVTDPWHSLRSRRMAQDLGFEVHTSPTRSGPAVQTRGTEVRYIARETAAYLYYRLFHRSSDAGPNAV
jgi:uncharacterized SAM-binding protein YcdF (DUF218 family)